MYKIGDFSRLCRVPVSALRYYADIGLLKPALVDPDTGYRYYSLAQLPALNRVLALKDLGLSLDQIAQLLRDGLPADQVRGMLRLKQAELQSQLADDQARLRRVEGRLKLMEQEGVMAHQEVILKQIEPLHVLSIRTIAPTPEYVGVLLGEGYHALLRGHVEPIGAPLAIFHDTEFKPTNLAIEIAFPVARSVVAPLALDADRRLAPTELPGIPHAACIIHSGPYEQFEQTYGLIAQWIAANGYRIAGPSREIYLSPPDAEAGPITEIQFPIAQ